jgi:hypothetical protein
LENIPQINSYEKMLYWNEFPFNSRSRKNRKKSSSQRPENRFYALTRLAHDTHQTIIEKGSPLRLCIYGDEDDISMDVIVMDNKKVNQSFTRSINNDNLKKLVKNIHYQIGLVLDYSL